jgi:membrane-associated phospholipid phosphatase
MESALTLAQSTPDRAVKPRPALAALRRQFLAMDVAIISFLVFVIAWTLLSMVAPGMRLYPYEARYAWAEMPKATLAIQLIEILVAYLVAQRFGIYFHRHYTTTGDRAPRWLAAANLVYVFIPVLLIPLVFNLLGAFIAGVSGVPGVQTHPAFDPAVNYDPAASYWDLWLKQLDIAITGVYPALWFRQHHAPWLSALALAGYLAYYVSPFVAVLPQVIRRDWPMVRRCAAVFAGALMTTYVGYILIPATGPRFEGGFAAWLPAEPLWLGAEWWQHVLNDAEVIRWDAFPSGHVAISVVALVLALRHHRKTGLVYLPFVLGLCFGTVFLGYHYLTDVLFGFLFAAFAFFALEPAAKWWESVWNKPAEA